MQPTAASAVPLSNDAAAQAAAAGAPTAAPQRSTYDQILKSSLLMGSSSLLSIAMGVLRIKVVAVLLGPSGFGLMGLFTQIADLCRSVAQMGVSNSGVRQIAQAVSTGDAQAVARTALVLRYLVVALGLVGAVLLWAFSNQVAQLTFGGQAHAPDVAWLAAAVFFGVVASGQTALIQGHRRIADMAWLGVWGAVFGALASIPIIYFWREAGVVPSLVVVAGLSLVAAWWYSRKVPLQAATFTNTPWRAEVLCIMKLGLAFMASGLLMMGVAYLVRLIVLRSAGLEAAGLYQAAWALGGLYVAFVLQAMGADFYPRLVAAAQDAKLCTRLVNEQAQVSLLLAGPGVLFTLTCAPLVIAVFYSREFAGAVETLRWICLGMALRVVTWPMGFIIMAKSQQAIFLATELAWSVVALALTWWLTRRFGVAGAGMAFAGAYVFHGLMIYPIVRRTSGFRWSPSSFNTGLVFLASIGAVMLAFYVLAPLWATLLGGAVTLLSALHSARSLSRLVSREALPRPVLRLLAWLGWLGLPTQVRA
jgi:enterobacterial common antigen flippase